MSMSMFMPKQSATSTDTGGQMSNVAETLNSTPSESGSESLSTTESFTMVDANISDTDYAQRCKELMALHADLSVLGAGDLLDLPRIVVIGCQSAGKSSLVEAVSGISVPRDSGTCTRCPMECSMSTSPGSWSCEISLRFDYDESGTRLSASRTETFCPCLTDKDSMDIWLRRAQAAILSPHLPYQNFFSKSLEDLRNATRTDARMLKFSKNTICLDLRDPDATVLSFVDLPGLIQNEAPNVIELVKGLVEDKIGGENSENTLILIAIPMSDDMENQQAVLLARHVDPRGERTVGVLTKPDTLSSGAINARQKWTDVIQGRAHSLKHGYYCVRLPDDDERSRDISRVESQRLAAEFFESTSPWNGLVSCGRFGIPVFVNNMSTLLVQLIENNLPKLKHDVLRLLDDCRQELSTLPTPVTNDPAAEILLRITKFCGDFRSAVYGDSYKQLAQNNRYQYAAFKRAIRKTAPDFRPFVESERYIKPWFPEEDPTNGSPDPAIKPLDLSDVRRVIKNSIAWELPNHVPFDATKLLIMQFTRLWHDPSIACFNTVFDNLSKTMDRLTNIHFGQFRLLQSHISSLTLKEIDICKEEALRTVVKTLELEKFPIFTQNVDYLESEGKKWLSRYSDAQRHPSQYHKPPPPRDEPESIKLEANCEFGWPRPTSPGVPMMETLSPSPSYERYERKVIQALKEAGYGNVRVEDLERLRTCEFQEELTVMARVRAYFQVAYKRIIDYIPLAIEHELNQALVDKLQESLFQVLLKEPEQMKELLREDPVVSKRRKFLEDRTKRLVEIQLKLENFRRDSVA